MATPSQASPSDKPKVTTMTYDIALIGGEGFQITSRIFTLVLPLDMGANREWCSFQSPGQMMGSKPSRTGAYWLADLVERLGWRVHARTPHTASLQVSTETALPQFSCCWFSDTCLERIVLPKNALTPQTPCFLSGGQSIQPIKHGFCVRATETG